MSPSKKSVIISSSYHVLFSLLSGGSREATFSIDGELWVVSAPPGTGALLAQTVASSQDDSEDAELDEGNSVWIRLVDEDTLVELGVSPTTLHVDRNRGRIERSVPCYCKIH